MEPSRTHHEIWMRHAIALARRGLGSTRPNPAVGCVIVGDDTVLAEGFHARAGAPHAEAAALAACSDDPRGATLFVTLEPCNHTGRTPPCSEAIVRAGIARVVVGARDPNPVAGGGVERLRLAGVEVITDVLSRECRAINPGFHFFHVRKRPLITLKWAMTADGCTSAVSGQSRWISGEESRAFVHQLRAEHDAILVGRNTALMDNARLTVRDSPGAEVGPPRHRMVLDARLETPAEHPLVVEKQGIATIVCTDSAPAEAEARLRGKGANVWRLPSDADGRIDLRAFVAKMAGEGIQSLLVEGGRTAAGAFLAAELVDRVIVFVAPKVLGGGEANLGAVFSASPPLGMDEAIELEHPVWRIFGTDAVLVGWFRGALED